MSPSSYNRFTEVRRSAPDISDSELLNSNNTNDWPEDKADVAVVGAGVIGLSYAIQLKKQCPHLNIAVFEKSSAPGYKIGESILSSFSRFLQGTTVPLDYLLHIFAVKDGLQFYHVDNDIEDRVVCEDIGGLDIAFQVDRRMLELFMTMFAQKMGIRVVHGAQAQLTVPGSATGRLAPRPTVTFKSSATLKARLVCDASGFSRALTGKFGKKERLARWNCNAYWAYFKERPDSPVTAESLGFRNWNYPATKHVCFPEGWGWFIKLMSWHHSPLPNLMDMVSYLLDRAAAGVPADKIPTVQSLSQGFGCPFEYITSIGWAVRDDVRFPEALDISRLGRTDSEQRFMYFQRRYAALDRLMTGGYELLPQYYGKQTYFCLKSLAYRSPVVAGPGWLAVGNAAGFTNPLISPGINAGIESAVLAAAITAEIVSSASGGGGDDDDHDAKSKSTETAALARYQAFSHDVMLPRLHLLNRYWYALFRDRRLFEALVPCFWANGVDETAELRTDAGAYTLAQLRWLVGAGSDTFVAFAQQVLAVLEPAPGDEEGAAATTEAQVDAVRALSRACLASRSAAFPGNKWSRYLSRRGDDLQLVHGKVARCPGAAYGPLRCAMCRAWTHNQAPACPVCGGGIHVHE